MADSRMSQCFGLPDSYEEECLLRLFGGHAIKEAAQGGPAWVGIGMNGILHPTALQWWGRQHEPMPLRWSLADPVASVAINMALQKELFASSRLPRCWVQDAYKQRPCGVCSVARSAIKRPLRQATVHPLRKVSASNPMRCQIIRPSFSVLRPLPPQSHASCSPWPRAPARPSSLFKSPGTTEARPSTKVRTSSFSRPEFGQLRVIHEQADRGPAQKRKRYIQRLKSPGDYPHRFKWRWHVPSASSAPPQPSCAPVPGQHAGYPPTREVRTASGRIWPPWAPNGRGVPARNLWSFLRGLAKPEAGHPK